ncbi:MAG TPA: hypothetical protein VHE54_14485 [Puia sp.]|nr:hypothetical protein [Puia sp.]
MPGKYRLYCLLLLLPVLGGCIFRGNPLTHLWFYGYGSGPGDDGGLTPANFLELRSDGSYTRDFGRYEFGSWKRKDMRLFLTDQQHKTYVYAIRSLTPEDLQLTVAKDRIGYFSGFPLPADRPAEDPFSPVNNQWRVPATHKESDAEIRQRLLNHCRFWDVYFSWALNKKLDAVDVRSTPTAIRIYGNGFGLIPVEELSPRWKGLFFDEEDCRKANDLIKDIFEHKTIAWAHTDSKYKLFIGAFQQLEQILRR